ncbi:MAG: PqqD family protein [Solirubrobacterales bacterium]
MKIKDGFMLREVAGQWVAVPLAEKVVEFNGIITLTETAAFVWRTLRNEVSEEEVVSALVAEYDVDENTARKDTRAFLACIDAKGLLV